MKTTLESIENRDSNFAKFVRGYLECALWSSSDGNGDAFDASHDINDFAEKALDEAIDTCEKFFAVYSCELACAVRINACEYDQQGHDFWLTRNGHGAGFWDRGLGCLGEKLSNACGHGTDFKAVSLYKGDDGKLYFDIG